MTAAPTENPATALAEHCNWCGADCGLVIHRHYGQALCFDCGDPLFDYMIARQSLRSGNLNTPGNASGLLSELIATTTDNILSAAAESKGGGL